MNEIKEEIENSIKVDYRKGDFLPKTYKTDLERAQILEMQQRNQLDYLAEKEELKKAQEIINKYNSNL